MLWEALKRRSRARRLKEHHIRWAICYYSGSGNTRLACEYVASRRGHDVDLIDIVTSPAVDLSDYDVVGLATFTDFGGIPQLFETFLESLPGQDDRPAFCLNTYGFVSGRTLPDMAEAATRAGFHVFAAHSLRTPESYPPMIAIRLGFAGQPSSSRMRGFERFVAGLDAGFDAEPVVKGSFLSGLRPTQPRTTARDDMGTKQVDEALCTRCGTCARDCPYAAVQLDPGPVFDPERCFGCWRCYNRCPQHAIYTSRFRGGPYYPRPSAHAQAVLAPRP